MRGHHDLIRPRRLWHTNWIMWTRCKLRTCDLIAWPSLGLQPYQFWSQHFSFLHPRTDLWHLLRSFLFEKHWFLAPHSPDPLPPPIPPPPSPLPKKLTWSDWKIRFCVNRYVSYFRFGLWCMYVSMYVCVKLFVCITCMYSMYVLHACMCYANISN